MQFIVDESAGRAVVEYLRSTGHDVLAVGETLELPRHAIDRVVWSRYNELVSAQQLPYRSGGTLAGSEVDGATTTA